MHASLDLNALQLPIHLGFTDEERANPQIVTIHITLHFDAIPAAIKTDSLEDTICYGALCENLFLKMQEKAYHLLEHLTHDIYQYIKLQVSTTTKISLTVSKNPPLTYLEQASFTLSD